MFHSSILETLMQEILNICTSKALVAENIQVWATTLKPSVSMYQLIIIVVMYQNQDQ